VPLSCGYVPVWIDACGLAAPLPPRGVGLTVSMAGVVVLVGLVGCWVSCRSHGGCL
jgi:hypothetical protein